MRSLINLVRRVKRLASIFSDAAANKYKEQFGFSMRKTTVTKIVEYMYAPKDASSLAVTRILFGLLMLLDISDERGGAVMEKRWGNPDMCHFPLIPFIKAVPMPYMAVVYCALWIGALGITLGYKYRISSITFAVCYWYLFIIEKSFWNNHSYLFGLISILLTVTDANCYWSIDVLNDDAKRKETVPYWNYFILKYQFFILYFIAGLKKGTAEWLTGYSVQNLSEHWVFSPFRLFMSVDQTDYLVVHWFVFFFDLTVAVWMMWSRTRHLAMVFCSLFHLMNSRLFRIGMFPWVCLAAMPLFYPFDWPKVFMKFTKANVFKIRKYLSSIGNKNDKTVVCKIEEQKKYCIDENVNGKNNVNGEEILRDDNNKGEMEQCSNFNELNNAKCFDGEEHKNHFQNFKDNEEIGKIVHQKTNFTEENQSEEATCENHSKIEKVTENEKRQDLDIQREKLENSDAQYICDDKLNQVEKGKIRTCFFILLYVISQAFLPYSHFITRGYNNWTNGLYGYSWDMMVHTWDIYSVVVKVVDNNSQEELYIDPYFYTPNDRWTRHGDMVYQYAHCLKKRILSQRNNGFPIPVSDNISIYIDVWCSMNGRFTQRMFDPRVDLLKATWSPFQPVSFLKPMLDEALHWRSTLKVITDKIAAQNTSDVIFFADFPGYEHEKYIPHDFVNVTVTVLKGTIAVVTQVGHFLRGQSYLLVKGEQHKLIPATLHKILTLGSQPAFYMYTFTNSTEAELTKSPVMTPKLPILIELIRRVKNMFLFGNIVISNLYQIFFHNTCGK